MSRPDGSINHVSDTALMVAACRALEAQDADGFVHDPFAARLAGDRGMAILEAQPHPVMVRFGIAARSRFIDELLLEAIAAKRVATVLSLGCGLDARPWRLELPPELRWIEVDFAEMLDYKDAALEGETPRCRRERIAADLNDAAQRRALFSATGDEPSILITEGLLMYLPGSTVDALAAEARESAVALWITDVTTSSFNAAFQREDAMRNIRKVQAPDCLPGEQILETLSRRGWTSEARRSYITDMAFAMPRVERMFGQKPPPENMPRFAPDDPSGVQRLARA